VNDRDVANFRLASLTQKWNSGVKQMAPTKIGKPWRFTVRAKLASILLCLVIHFPIYLWGQQRAAASGDEVVQRFLQAVGQDRWGSIKTLVRKGEITGDVTRILEFYRPPKLSKEHATWESYYKTPNLHLSFIRTSQNTAASMQGCDGTTPWAFSPWGGLREYKIKPGEHSICDSGLSLAPTSLIHDKSHFVLKGKKVIDGKEDYAVDVTIEGSEQHVTFFFDPDTYLLVRTSAFSNSRDYRPIVKHEVAYSDYRNVGGIFIAF
jgi:hypothetical protein